MQVVQKSQFSYSISLLQNFAMNIDEFKSQFMLLCAKYDPDYQPKHVLNHDFSFSTAARV